MIGAISLLVIVIGGCLAISNPAIFVLYYGITASSTDAYGIASFLSTGFGQYSFVMQLLLILAFLVSIYNSRFMEKKLFITVGSYFLMCLWMAIVIFQKSFSTEMFYIGTLNVWIEQMSPIYLIILMLNRKRTDIKRLFELYVVIHVLFAFMVIYLPLAGVNIFSVIKSSNYLNDNTSLYDAGVAGFSNFTQLFSDKYAFNQLAYFHNSNDTGFFGGVGIVVGMLNFVNSENKKHKVLWGILIFCAIALWFNSGMKGPIVGIAAGLVLFWYINKKDTLSFFFKIWILLFLILMALYGSDLINVIFENIFSRTSTLGNSILTRVQKREAGYKFILENPIWGSGASFDGLLSRKIDPHELPLRFAVLFGIPAGFMSLVLYYLVPISSFVNKVKNSLAGKYQCVLLMICIAVSLTNNYTDVVLFFFTLYVACFDEEKMLSAA